MISTEKRFGQYVLRPATEIYKEVLLDVDHEGDGDGDGDDRGLQCSIPSRWTKLRLLEIRKYNHDTSFFRFELPVGAPKLNLAPGSHLLVKAPNREHGGGDAIRPYTTVSSEEEQVRTGTFELLVKRYAEWGVKESLETHFLFTKTNHTYRPAGAVSNYIHSLSPGDDVEFKHVPEVCLGRFPLPLPLNVKTWTLIAVGVGVAPMISIIRHIFSTYDDSRVTLLYGVRECADILLKEILEGPEFPVERFKLVYCVGTRFANIHMGAKTKNEHVPPPPPTGYNEMELSSNSCKTIGWVNEDKIRTHGFPPSNDTRVVVCGLPGVYDKLCGSRFEPNSLTPGCALSNLSYAADTVLKL
jgi:cytochrome-b5 reductase